MTRGRWHRSGVTQRVSIAALAFSLSLPIMGTAAEELMTPEQALADIGLEPDVVQKVLSGQFASTTLAPSNEREIAVGLAFFVPVPLSDVRRSIQDDVITTADPNTLAHGSLDGDATVASFEGLRLVPDASQEVHVYLNARPGEDLNLDESEIEALRAARSGAGSEEARALTAVKALLLGRYDAYRLRGLAGVAPYERGGGQSTPAGADLRSATKALVHVQKYAPAFYQVLLDYPKAKPAALDERFEWSHSKTRGNPNFDLTHWLSMPDRDAFVLCQRQFYVARGYNTEQAVAAFIPVQGGTLVIYENRTSTDQITGFGESGKRSIGSRLMTSQLERLFQRVRAEAERTAD